MSMVCPKCEQAYDQALQCPDCGVRLLYHARKKRSKSGSSERPQQWQQTPWGRIVVGVLLTQGLAHGMELLVNAGVQAAGEKGPESLWTTLWGLALLQAMFGISLLIGGALTAAGQRSGPVLGSIVGLGSGLGFLILRQLKGDAMTEVIVYGQPLLHVIFGALGGLIGSTIWKPLPVVQIKLPEVDKSAVPAARQHTRPSAFSGPVLWWRVLVGIVVVVIGFVSPNAILDFVLHASQGQLSVNNTLQAQLVTWEISGLVTLIGAGFAGSTTWNGLKQGLVVGLGASIMLVGYRLGSRSVSLEQTALLLLAIICLALVGAWFGGQLFPPIRAGRRRSLGPV